MKYESRKYLNGVLISVNVNGENQFELDGMSKDKALSVSAIPYFCWPLWAKSIGNFRRQGETGIGDTVARIIGPENSEKFKTWYEMEFGKPCGCKGRQQRLNDMYPYQ